MRDRPRARPEDIRDALTWARERVAGRPASLTMGADRLALVLLTLNDEVSDETRGA